MNDAATTDSQADRAHKIALAHAQRPGALLPILHAIQNEAGYISESAVAAVADVLSLSRAEVHGVISFYHLFRSEPPGGRTIYLCRAEACQAMGARALEVHVKDRLGVDFHETTEDGRLSLEPIYCACSPAVMIDQDVHGRVDSVRFDELLEDG